AGECPGGLREPADEPDVQERDAGVDVHQADGLYWQRLCDEAQLRADSGHADPGDDRAGRHGAEVLLPAIGADIGDSWQAVLCLRVYSCLWVLGAYPVPVLRGQRLDSRYGARQPDRALARKRLDESIHVPDQRVFCRRAGWDHWGSGADDEVRHERWVLRVAGRLPEAVLWRGSFGHRPAAFMGPRRIAVD